MLRCANPDDAAAIASVHVESWRSSYRGLMPDAVLDGLNLERRKVGWQHILENHDNQCSFVITNKEAIVGFGNGGPERDHDPIYTEELYVLYLLESQQKRGWSSVIFGGG